MQQTLRQQLSAVVFETLKATKSGANLEMRELGRLNENKLREATGHNIMDHISMAIAAAYLEFRLFPADFDAAIDAAKAKLEEILREEGSTTDPRLLEEKVRAFEAEYLGDADTQFQNYLAACCSVYRRHSLEYTAPYLTITQSSGFGKSCILQRLAENTAKGLTLVNKRDRFDVTVLYMCARNIKGSTGYPRATTELRNWLFPQKGCDESSIVTALLKAFKYATEHPDAKTQWRVLFDNGKDSQTFDGDIVQQLNQVKLDRLQRRSSSLPADDTTKPVVVGAELGEQPVGDHPGKRRRGETIRNPRAAKQQRVSETAKIPLLVVAIDEARSLLGVADKEGVNGLQLLRRALRTVNNSLDSWNLKAGSIFAVLVDTSSQVHDFVPALEHDPSSRGNGGTALFPPFILTHTMDVMLSKSASCSSEFPSKSRVLDTDPSRVWEALVLMGRPLWSSIEQGVTLNDRQRHLNVVAASKLLLGVSDSEATSYSNTTLHGVASLFCRVGLSPRESDHMTTRLVADFMSVLHYKTVDNDAAITSYVSEPILTFGASHMWYQLSPPALESHVLRQFQAVLVNGVVDTGNIGEIVARIFLLLAFDATIMGRKTKSEFVFSGQFCPVLKFVTTLVGDTQDPNTVFELGSCAGDEGFQRCGAWMERWKSWEVGFSHFVDLWKEPTKAVLWKLLDRRAAGILPRNQKGADLIIPIFSRAERDVSFILIQVENRKDKDDQFPESALSKLEPKNVFDDADLQGVDRNDMIRLYISLRERPTTERPPQCVLLSKAYSTRSVVEEGKDPEDDFSLCIRGMFAPDSDLTDIHDRWPFLSEELTKQLAVIANSAWWEPQVKIACDLDNCDDSKRARVFSSRVLSSSAALGVASNTLDIF